MFTSDWLLLSLSTCLQLLQRHSPLKSARQCLELLAADCLLSSAVSRQKAALSQITLLALLLLIKFVSLKCSSLSLVIRDRSLFCSLQSLFCKLLSALSLSTTNTKDILLLPCLSLYIAMLTGLDNPFSLKKRRFKHLLPNTNTMIFMGISCSVVLTILIQICVSWSPTALFFPHRTP